MWLIGNVTRADVISGICTVSRVTAATLKVLIVTVGSIFAVVFASLIISIIQFQLRLNEARTQNENITLESIQLIADYQDNISNHYKQMRDQADQLNALRTNYLSQLNSTTQLITNLCMALNAEKVAPCYSQLRNLINTNNSEIDAVVREFGPKNDEELKNGPVPTYVAGLKKVVTSGALQKAQQKFFTTQSFVQSECQTLSQYVSERLGSSSLLSVSPELRMTIVVQCFAGSVGSQSLAQAVSGQENTVMPSASAADDSPAPQDSRETTGVNRILLSELVFYYKFYDWLTSFAGANFRQIILSPPEFIVIMLVISTGILGSFLFHTYTMFVAKSMNEFPPLLSIGLRATLSVMCALVIYILSRTGFVAITEGGQRSIEAAISPFVIAFISVASGLMAEKALERIRAIGINALQSRTSGPQTALRASDQRARKRPRGKR